MKEFRVFLKGGMITKLMAARTATQAGCAMVITKGDVPNPITELENEQIVLGLSRMSIHKPPEKDGSHHRSLLVN